MKNFKLLLLIVIPFSFYSCSEEVDVNPNKDLLGEWELKDISNLPINDKNDLLNVILVFNAENHFINYDNNGSLSVEGTWEINGWNHTDINYLTFSENINVGIKSTTQFDILKINESELWLQERLNMGSYITYHFNKISSKSSM